MNNDRWPLGRRKTYLAITILAGIVMAGVGVMIEASQDCAFGAGAACSHPKASVPPVPPAATSNARNFIVIVTDDQRFDTLQYMPNVSSRIVNAGINFNTSFATTPYCCPARASFMSGGVPSYETNILSITIPNGGATQYNDTVTIATELQKAGYKTGLVGKYLNEYEKLGKHIPPGWTFWRGTYPGYEPTVQTVEGSSTYNAPTTGVRKAMGQYSAYYMRDQALGFLDSYKDDPFFLYIGFTAPHAPFIPAPGDENAFNGFNYTSPGVLETDLSDKPSAVHAGMAPNNPTHFERIRQDEEKQLETLPAVDRSVNAILDKLQSLGIADKTIVFFTSDNGYMWNEHGGLEEKKYPYEESIRIPLAVLYPGVSHRNVADKLVTWNLDIPATVIDIAGLKMYTEGKSLKPLILDTPTTWRDHLILQEFGSDDNNSIRYSWAEYRNATWAYIEYINGEKELYHVSVDPYELSSQHVNATYAASMAAMSAIIDQGRGLTIKTQTPLPPGTVGTAYNQTITAWGGTTPYIWTLEGGSLPPGLTLDGGTGVLHGTPTEMGTYSFYVKVTDSASLPVIHVHGRYILQFSCTINS